MPPNYTLVGTRQSHQLYMEYYKHIYHMIYLDKPQYNIYKNIYKKKFDTSTINQKWTWLTMASMGHHIP